MVKKTKDLKYYEGVGRRKEAVAQVRLYIVGKDKTATFAGAKLKAGEILVNKKPINQVFPGASEKKVYLNPLRLTQNEERFVVVIQTRGGGQAGQLDAIVHGLSRALEKVDKEATRAVLKKHGFFTRDARARQRRKVGMGGKSRRAKQSPKR